MGKRRLKQLHEIAIDGMSSEGMGIGHHGEKVVFVEQAVPGDVVDVRVQKNRSKYIKGSANKLHKASDLRIEPFCAHFGLCGGCKWQFLEYKQQLEYKDQIVKDALQRIGKVEVEEMLPILAAPQDRLYRNKLEFTFSNRKWLSQDEVDSGEDFNRNGLGFHIRNYFDKVVDLENCHLQEEPSNSIRMAFRELALEREISFYDIRERKGLLRNLIIRSSSLGEWLVILVVSEFNEQVEKLMNDVHKKFPQITSLQYIINTKNNDSISDLEAHCLSGRDHILEELGGFRFKIGPKSFFQTNSKQAERLYEQAREMAGLSGGEILYDLYTGVGSIGIFMSEKAGKVVGLEYIPEAIEDAKENARLNKLDHCHFYDGDVKDLFGPELFEKHGKPDVLVLDPPRAGMHPDVVERIMAAEVPRIVYISCNPGTQARDIQLTAEKYNVLKSQAVDMFPQTTHIENIALLSLR